MTREELDESATCLCQFMLMLNWPGDKVLMTLARTLTQLVIERCATKEDAIGGLEAFRTEFLATADNFFALPESERPRELYEYFFPYMNE